MEQVIGDILVNVLSDIVFILIVILVLFFLYRRRIFNAFRFFGASQSRPIWIFVSSHSDENTRTQQVVTALEYEAAVLLREIIQQISGNIYVRTVRSFLFGLIGSDFQMPTPIIEISSLEEITEVLPFDSLILIGGPVRNQVTKYYSDKKNPLLRYDVTGKRYVGRSGTETVEISNVSDTAVLVRMTVHYQVVFLVFGTGEKETKGAVRYLAENWRDLWTRYGKNDFGILLVVNAQGMAQEKQSFV